MRNRSAGISPDLAAVFSACLLAAPVWGHHSFAAEFDINRPVHLEGAIVDVEWVNPHVEIHIDARGSDGNVVRWTVEAGSPSMLLMRGVTKISVPEGALVAVDGYRAKNEALRATGVDLVLPDGQKLLLDARKASGR